MSPNQAYQNRASIVHHVPKQPKRGGGTVTAVLVMTDRAHCVRPGRGRGNKKPVKIINLNKEPVSTHVCFVVITF